MIKIAEWTFKKILSTPFYISITYKTFMTNNKTRMTTSISSESLKTLERTKWVIEQMFSSHNKEKKQREQKLKEDHETLKIRLCLLEHDRQTDGQNNL